MAAIPITLPSGVIAVYGAGSLTGIQGVVSNEGYLWGTVNKVFDGGEVFVYGGDSILFREEDIVCRLAWDNSPYTLININTDLIIKEDPNPP